MTDVSWNTIGGLILRHLLFSAGTWLVGHGYIQSSAMEAFVGAGTMIGGIAWSVWQKQGQAALLADAHRAYDNVVEQWRRHATSPKQPPAPSVAKQ